MEFGEQLDGGYFVVGAHTPRRVNTDDLETLTRFHWSPKLG